jgi:phosphoserine aminotransferase
MQKPQLKPTCPHFSSGPCAKRPGWSVDALKDAALGRSHRSTIGKSKLKEVIDRHRSVLNIPEDNRIAIVPASDTGAVEMALWSLLGPRGVDVVAFESFGQEWLTDITKQLKLPDVRTHTVDYGALPDLNATSADRDIVFTWNGTTSGVRVPHADWIKDDREGLTICDATSAVFAYDLPWHKLDVVTWSWQKAIGSEAAHGMLVLSPRAVERLQSHTPSWPLPKIFRMTKKGALAESLFAGETINTPSMLAVEDCLDALKWAETEGGLQGLLKRTHANMDALSVWVAHTDWVTFLAEPESVRSCTSVCLKIVDPWFTNKNDEAQQAFIKSMTKLLEKENVAFDIAGYRDAPAGLRIWCGATVESNDVLALTPWLDWAYHTTKEAV